MIHTHPDNARLTYELRGSLDHPEFYIFWDGVKTNPYPLIRGENWVGELWATVELLKGTPEPTIATQELNRMRDKAERC